MIADRTIRNLMRPGGDLTSIESTLLDRRHGMDNALAEFVKAGHISRQEAMRASNDAVYLERELSG